MPLYIKRKHDGIVDQAEQDDRDSYQQYYGKKSRGGNSALKGARTYAQWKKMNTAERKTHMQLADAD